jgi:DNA-binding MarR family transcriptional regulator
MNKMAREERIGTLDDLLHDILRMFLRPRTPPRADMNVTLGQMHCLREIARLGNPTMSQVAEALGLHPSTVTVLVDGLVAHGLAQRTADPKDRRVVRAKETAKGRKNHERHMAQMRARVTEMLSGLSDADLTGVYESLDTLREAARQHAESEGLQGGRSRAASVPQR